MTKDEMKNKISMALKDPILQQGFECICKENAELKEENKKVNTVFADIIEAFTSCSYNDDFEMAQAGKEIYELFYGGKDPKEVFHNAEVPKSSRQLLAEAKKIIRHLVYHITNDTFAVIYETKKETIERAKAFLKECEE